MSPLRDSEIFDILFTVGARREAIPRYHRALEVEP